MGNAGQSVDEKSDILRTKKLSTFSTDPSKTYQQRYPDQWKHFCCIWGEDGNRLSSHLSKQRWKRIFVDLFEFISRGEGK